MTLDEIKGRTYTSTADFWRDLERLVGTLQVRLDASEALRADMATRLEAAQERVAGVLRDMDAAHELLIYLVAKAGGTVRVPAEVRLDPPRKRIWTRVDPISAEFVIEVRDRE